MDQPIYLFIIFGFIAQIIDGALGMGFGVSSTTLLMSFGVPPAAASAAVHATEVFTTAASGISHFKIGNVKTDMLKKLVVPGVLGAAVGAYLLSNLPGGKIKPFIAVYLAVMGLVILWKAARKAPPAESRTPLIPLGLAGGFLDAIGGGGWGPIVTSTLVARGGHPRFTVGSVNLAEFFVAFSASVAFLLSLGFVQYWKIIAGLGIGGVLAAPLAAIVCKKLPVRTLMVMVGLLILILSLRTMVLSLG
ncbi:MAG TPA: sulfite exporter TauE/SafE family protein [bacterium]